MSTRQHRGSMPWVVAGLLFLLVAYPASMGPVAWGLMWWHALDWPWSDEIGMAFSFIYFPVYVTVDVGPEWLESMFSAYIHWGSPEP